MATAISTKYYGLVALAARQCFVGTEVSVGKAASGEYNTSDIMSFTKGMYLAGLHTFLSSV